MKKQKQAPPAESAPTLAEKIRQVGPLILAIKADVERMQAIRNSHAPALHRYLEQCGIREPQTAYGLTHVCHPAFFYSLDLAVNLLNKAIKHYGLDEPSNDIDVEAWLWRQLEGLESSPLAAPAE